MNITLISPRIAIQKGDFLGSGVPYWPVEMAITAAALRNAGDNVAVCDLFGSDVGNLSDGGDHYLQGIDIATLLNDPRITMADAYIVYAMSYMSLRELQYIVRTLRQTFPKKVIAVQENSQAVTGFALDADPKTFLGEGADFIICGEPYHNLTPLRQKLSGADVVTENTIDQHTPQPYAVKRMIDKAGHYPVPAWDLFPLQGYWKLPYAHGPKSGRYLPIISMRGCPYPCDFCTIPDTNDRRWRPRQPEDVVDEIIELRDKLGVRKFHVEDVNPTVNFRFWERIAELLIERRARIKFYYISGTKAETVPVDKVALLARAGCRYISISPESGDTTVMQRIGKRFDYAHGLALVAECHKHGIRTQACFLVGHPGEQPDTTEKTADYMRQLLAAGLDEAAIFVVAPLPGSDIYKNKRINLVRDGLVSFSPETRSDYARASANRRYLIKTFFIGKLKQGLSLWLMGLRAVFCCSETKIENLPWRTLFLNAAVWKFRLGKSSKV